MTDTPPAVSPRRRRGAPLCNLNALKHRIPRQRLASRRRPSDLEDLADCKFTDLKEEMTTPRVRVYMRSVIEQRGSTPSSAATLEESIEVPGLLACQWPAGLLACQWPWLPPASPAWPVPKNSSMAAAKPSQA